MLSTTEYENSPKDGRIPFFNLINLYLLCSSIGVLAYLNIEASNLYQKHPSLLAFINIFSGDPKG